MAERTPAVRVLPSPFDYSIPQRPLFDAATRARLLARLDAVDAAQARALAGTHSVVVR